MPPRLTCSSNGDKFSLSLDEPSLINEEDAISESTKDEIRNKLAESFNNNKSEIYFEIIIAIKLSQPQITKIIEDISKIDLKDTIVISYFLEFQRDENKILSFFGRKKTSYNSFFEIRVASAGNVDAGKSTILGVLTYNIFDDGRGSARVKIFKHPHEAESGRTSAVGDAVLGFDSYGNSTFTSRQTNTKTDSDQICNEAYKVINFIDLAGHEKYLKTTIFGMVGLRPDYVMLMIGANMGLVGMSKEHLGLSLALSIPIFFVITKIDICPEDVRKSTLDRLIKIIKGPSVRKKHIVIKSIEDVLTSFININSNMLCPIFQVSSVTGECINYLKTFISLLPQRQTYKVDASCLFWIDESFNVPGIGCVVCGILAQGLLKKNMNYLIGPFKQGDFIQISFKSIHRKRIMVDQLLAGQSGAIAVKKLKREEVRKGMVIVSQDPPPHAYWRFRADIHILHHPTTIGIKYQAVVHVGPIRQASVIVWMDKNVLRTGDKASVLIKFSMQPEYLILGSTFVFREGRTKAVGSITELLEPVSLNIKPGPTPKSVDTYKEGIPPLPENKGQRRKRQQK